MEATKNRPSRLLAALFVAPLAVAMWLWVAAGVAGMMGTKVYVRAVMVRPASDTGSFRKALKVTAFLESRRETDINFLSPIEKSHMSDVAAVFDLVGMIGRWSAGALAVLILVLWLRGEKTFLLIIVRRAALTALAAMGIMLATALISFDWLFVKFHQLFFPQGNWLFAPGSALVTLFPEDFWALSAIVLLMGVATALILIYVASSLLLSRYRRVGVPPAS